MSLNPPQLFRLTLGLILISELITRIPLLPSFYSSTSTHPLTNILPLSPSYALLSLPHTIINSNDKVWTNLIITTVHIAVEIANIVDVLNYPKADGFSKFISWYLYLSLTLRNTWLTYILDRYLIQFLLLSSFLTYSNHTNTPNTKNTTTVHLHSRVAMVLTRIQLIIIYLDAGISKYRDPSLGWTSSPSDGVIPALDSYTRHTYFARLTYTMVGGGGLRFMTPVVVWVEILGVPIAVLMEVLGNYVVNDFSKRGYKIVRGVRIGATVTVQLLHLGIGLCVRNSFTLSLTAISTLFLLYPPLTPISPPQTSTIRKSGYLPLLTLLTFYAFSLYYNLNLVTTCSQTTSVMPTMFFNRWNVFTSSERYVTWEVVVGEFEDGRKEDIWSGSNKVDWNLPLYGIGKRSGRWRSYQYLAERDVEEEEAFWGWFCRDNEGLKGFEFWMCKAETEEDMGYGETTRKLIKVWKCGKEEEEEKVEVIKNYAEERDGGNDEF